MPSQMYLDMCDAEKDLHIRKSAGYAGQNPDPWVNFRSSAGLGVEPWRGAMIRMLDKVARAISLAGNPDNDKVGESFEDTMSDLSAYAKIVICLRRGDGDPLVAKIDDVMSRVEPVSDLLPADAATRGAKAAVESTWDPRAIWQSTLGDPSWHIENPSTCAGYTEHVHLRGRHVIRWASRPMMDSKVEAL